MTIKKHQLHTSDRKKRQGQNEKKAKINLAVCDVRRSPDTTKNCDPQIQTKARKHKNVRKKSRSLGAHHIAAMLQRRVSL